MTPALPAAPARFWLGTHQPGWLARAGVPLFISDVRLRVYRRLPAAAAPWALDSGGFTELQRFGRWTTGPAEYADRVRRYRDVIGELTWAAPQDWMCEPIVINGGRAGRLRFAGTHLSVAEHQRRTVASYLHLPTSRPTCRSSPCCRATPARNTSGAPTCTPRPGSTLPAEPLVGLGSVCRRQATAKPTRSSPPCTPAASPACTGSASRSSAWRGTGTC